MGKPEPEADMATRMAHVEDCVKACEGVKNPLMNVPRAFELLEDFNESMRFVKPKLAVEINRFLNEAKE